MDEQEEQELSLEDILKEFSQEQAEEEAEAAEDTAQEEVIRTDLPPREKKSDAMGDTIRLEGLPREAEEEAPEAPPQASEQPPKAEPYSEEWEPEYDEPMGEYIPPQPIPFQPRSRLRELKRKLVAGPEKRYYELTRLGTGKLQVLILLSLLVVALSAGTTIWYAGGNVGSSRMKLMVFGQFFALLLSALLGSQLMLSGAADLFRGRFSLNTMLVFTFAACAADGILCLRQLRVPCCAAFGLEVTMALWAEYHRRTVKIRQMDTMRRASRLDSVALSPDFLDGKKGLLRGEGDVDDFMEHCDERSGPEKVLSWYAAAALLLSIASGVAGGVLQNSVSFGVQVLAAALLAAVPATAFITLTRPAALLERRLHALGTVLCGWQGVKGACGKAAFPVSHEDLFPAGSCNLNGVKFYGARDPDEVVAYATALISADGGGLEPLFTYLLDSRNGHHYEAESLRVHSGGIGGEVRGESVLVGTPAFLKEMGVEIPQGTRVNQAVYVAIDGELCGLFAVTYAKERGAAAGLGTLCAYRRLSPVLTSCDFMLTEGFLRSRFGVNTRRMAFPERAARRELAEKEPEADAQVLVLTTQPGLAPAAFGVTGARALNTADRLGLTIHMLGGILGLAIMAALAVLGAAELLTPSNMLLYELVWMIPGLLATEWTRSI